MASHDNIWFRIGHALERARYTAPSPKSVPPGRAEGDAEEDGPVAPRHPIPSSDELMAAGVTLMVDRTLAGWGRRSDPGFGRLLWAAVAGASAALLTDLVRPLLRDDADLAALDRDTAGHILAGIGQGLVYGGVIEPRIPGPALVKGALYGSVEFAAHPLGGLSDILGSHSPQRKIPFVGDVLDGLDGSQRAYLEHLVFGIALAIIYESSASSNGMRPDDA